MFRTQKDFIKAINDNDAGTIRKDGDELTLEHLASIYSYGGDVPEIAKTLIVRHFLVSFGISYEEKKQGCCSILDFSELAKAMVASKDGGLSVFEEATKRLS